MNNEIEEDLWPKLTPEQEKQVDYALECSKDEHLAKEVKPATRTPEQLKFISHCYDSRFFMYNINGHGEEMYKCNVHGDWFYFFCKQCDIEMREIK